LLLVSRVTLWSDVCTVILDVLVVRVGCAINDIIIIILLWYVCLLYYWWIHLRLLCSRGLVWLYSVAPCPLGVVGSRNIRLVKRLSVLSHLLRSSRMLRWHPRRLGALQVFWPCGEELVECFYNLTRRFLDVYVFPTSIILFPS
jgi:hypothetical protein